MNEELEVLTTRAERGMPTPRGLVRVAARELGVVDEVMAATSPEEALAVLVDAQAAVDEAPLLPEAVDADVAHSEHRVTPDGPPELPEPAQAELPESARPDLPDAAQPGGRSSPSASTAHHQT